VIVTGNHDAQAAVPMQVASLPMQVALAIERVVPPMPALGNTALSRAAPVEDAGLAQGNPNSLPRARRCPRPGATMAGCCQTHCRRQSGAWVTSLTMPLYPLLAVSAHGPLADSQDDSHGKTCNGCHWDNPAVFQSRCT